MIGPHRVVQVECWCRVGREYQTRGALRRRLKLRSGRSSCGNVRHYAVTLPRQRVRTYAPVCTSPYRICPFEKFGRIEAVCRRDVAHAAIPVSKFGSGAVSGLAIDVLCGARWWDTQTRNMGRLWEGWSVRQQQVHPHPTLSDKHRKFRRLVGICVRVRLPSSSHIPHKVWVEMWGEPMKQKGRHPDRVLTAVKVNSHHYKPTYQRTCSAIFLFSSSRLFMRNGIGWQRLI